MTHRFAALNISGGRTPKTRLVILLAVVLAYALCFPLLYRSLGNFVSAAGILPAVTAGLLFGTGPGLLAGILVCLPNVFPLYRETFPQWGIPQTVIGSLVIAGLGAAAGHMRDFGEGWRREASKLAESEKMLERRNRELAIFSAIAQALGHSVKIDDVLDLALNKVLEVLEVNRGGIYLVTENGLNLELAIQIGLEQEQADALRVLPFGSGITGGVAKSGESLVINDKVVEQSLPSYRAALQSAGIRSAIFVPLKSKGKTVGVFTASSQDVRNFTQEETALVEAIGGQIGSAIETARLFERMNRLSLTDELTGLYNRRHFTQVLDSETLRAVREGRSFTLVMIDLDSFKDHNDTYGHQSGDELLKAFAAVLKSEPRKSDTAFRLGGDEFGIILPGASADVASRVVGRVTSAWQKVRLPGPRGQIATNGFSIGVAEFPVDSETSHGLMGVADAELYRDKSVRKSRAARPVIGSDAGAIQVTEPSQASGPTPVAE